MSQRRNRIRRLAWATSHRVRLALGGDHPLVKQVATIAADEVTHAIEELDKDFRCLGCGQPPSTCVC